VERGVSSKYAPIGRYLNAQEADEVELTFAQIESILGFPLPSSARGHDAWWQGGSTHSQTLGWEDSGWSLAHLDRRGKRVSFHRVSRRHMSSSPSPAPLSPDGRKIGLVGCVKTKLDQSAPARDLYTSPLFRGRRAWVEQTCSRWFVLSALHGLVDPERVIEPYDVTLGAASIAQRQAWSAKVLDQLEKRLGSLSGLVFEIHAGADYTDFGLIDGLRKRGATVELPVAGLKMGEQLSTYQNGPEVATSVEAPALAESRIPERQPAAVGEALQALDGQPHIVPASAWPGDLQHLDKPGLYAWWVDEEGARQLTDGLGILVPAGRIYAGQAGATKWPSGRSSDNTLAQRIGQMHLGGKVRMSTFRWTLASALFTRLGVGVRAPMVITAESEEALTAWMGEHLSLAVFPCDDPDSLESLEQSVLASLDPPLNLKHMAASDVRSRLTEARLRISRD
jgi:hypothetical protein